MTSEDNDLPVLHLLWGQIASGKSTLAVRLAKEDSAVLISEDAWLHCLFSEQMGTVADYVRCSAALRSVLGPHVSDILNAGVSVVLDAPANTLETRQWMRAILHSTRARHVLHMMDVPDPVCLDRLRNRNARGDHPFRTTEAQFQLVSRHITVPTSGEGFVIRRHTA